MKFVKEELKLVSLCIIVGRRRKLNDATRCSSKQSSKWPYWVFTFKKFNRMAL